MPEDKKCLLSPLAVMLQTRHTRTGLVGEIIITLKFITNSTTENEKERMGGNDQKIMPQISNTINHNDFKMINMMHIRIGIYDLH